MNDKVIMKLSKFDKVRARRWRWQLAVRQLRDAYNAARSAIDDDLHKLQLKAEKFVASGAPDPDDFEEVEAYSAHEDHLYERSQEALCALNSIKQGFAVVLYHSWEKHSADWTDWAGKYRHHHVAAKLTKDIGYNVEDGVHRLNDLANCIKHDGAELWNNKATRHMFDPIVQSIIDLGGRPDYSRYLAIPDEDMNSFFDALSRSGPSG